MAEKNFAEKEEELLQPPKVDDISPHQIYQNVIKIPLFTCLGILVLVFELQYLNYLNSDYIVYLNANFCHPGLMSFSKYMALRHKYKKTKKTIASYKSKDEPVPENYEDLKNELKSILDEQDHLNAICWFKMFFGMPQSSFDLEFERDIVPETCSENIKTEIVAKYFYDIISDTNTEDAETGTSTKNSYDIESDTDKESDSSKIDWHESVPDVNAKIVLEELKNQIAQMQVENAKLKNTVEKLVASQTVV